MPFTYDWPHATGRHTRIMKHTIPIAKLRQWTSAMKATLPSCMPSNLLVQSPPNSATSDVPSDVPSDVERGVAASGGGAAQGEQGLKEPPEPTKPTEGSEEAKPGLTGGLGRSVAAQAVHEQAVVPHIASHADAQSVPGRAEATRKRKRGSKVKAKRKPQIRLTKDRFGCLVEDLAL